MDKWTVSARLHRYPKVWNPFNDGFHLLCLCPVQGQRLVKVGEGRQWRY